jgi:hypothetical protein
MKNNKKDAIIQIENLKDWLYIKGGSFPSRHEWRTVLILALNEIKKTITDTMGADGKRRS